MTYNAFISYSHSQHALQARGIHKELSRFATPWYRRRRVRLFLDDANLPASPSLWKAIELALDESEYFLLLASPAAAASPWCAREIQQWLAHKAPDRIIVVLLAGAIRWDARANDVDWENTTALPQALRGVFKDEPRYIDLTSSDTKAGYKSASHRAKLADIAAVLLGKSKDELIGEDLSQQRRALRLAWGAALVLLTTSLIAAWQWYEATVQRDLANERLTQAVDITERMLFDIDEKLVGVAGAGGLRRSLTREALSLLIELRQKAAGDEGVEWHQMTAYYQKGNLALRYGDLDEAEEAFAESEKLAKSMVDKWPGYIEPYHSWGLSHHGLAKVHAQKKALPKAYAAFDRAKQLAQFVLEDHPDDEDALLLLMHVRQDWGDAAYESGDMRTAHENYSAGIKLVEKLAAENPTDAEYQFLYAIMLDRKARYFPLHVDPMRQLDVREEAVEVLKRLVDQFPETAKYRLNLGVAYEKMGEIALAIRNLKGARSYFASAVEQMQALFAAEPINNLYKSMLAVNYGNLGKVHLALGQHREALGYFAQEHAWMQTLASIDPANAEYASGYILAKRHLGDFHARTRQVAKATEHYRSAINLATAFMEKHGEVRRAHLLLAALRVELAGLLADSNAETALRLAGQCIADLDAWLDKHPREGEGWLYLAQARAHMYRIGARTGDAAGAKRAAQQAVAAIARMSTDDRKKYAMEISSVLASLQK